MTDAAKQTIWVLVSFETALPSAGQDLASVSGLISISLVVTKDST